MYTHTIKQYSDNRKSNDRFVLLLLLLLFSYKTSNRQTSTKSTKILPQSFSHTQTHTQTHTHTHTHTRVHSFCDGQFFSTTDKTHSFNRAAVKSRENRLCERVHLVFVAVQTGNQASNYLAANGHDERSHCRYISQCLL